MKKKININITLISLFSILTTSIVLIFVYYGLFQNQVISDLKKTTELISDTRIFSIENKDLDNLFFDDYSDELRITWIDDDGEVLYDNQSDIKILPNHSDRPEIIDALKNGEGKIIRKSDTFDLDTYYYALHMDNGTVLRLSCEAKNIKSVFLMSLPLVVFISLVIFIISYFIGHKLTKQIIKPINDLAENIDGTIIEPKYEELKPFADKILSQHEKILESVQIRQEFTANISHELKTPLTALSGYAELVENDMIDENQFKSISKEIRSNVNRLLSLINDVIKLTELDITQNNYEFKCIDIYTISDNVINELKPVALNKEVTLHLSGANTNINGNEQLISELIENIVSNAIRYNVANGRVNVNIYTVSNKKILEVSDTGIGIPKESIDRIFERFYRVDKSRSRKTGGTGLGLAIVKHIAQIHDANIEVESQLGSGTTIRITFN